MVSFVKFRRDIDFYCLEENASFFEKLASKFQFDWIKRLLRLNENIEFIPTGQMTQYPFNSMVKINDSNGKNNGSGVLIGKDLVLTAAHCVHYGCPGNSCKTDLKFKAAFNPDWQGSESTPLEIFVHKEWVSRKSWENDIAIVKTNREIGDSFLGVKIDLKERVEYWTSYGYPVKGVNGKDFLYFDTGAVTEFCGREEIDNRCDPETVEIQGSDFTSINSNRLSEGASGGPFIPHGIDVSGLGVTIVEGKSDTLQSPTYIGGINSFNCNYKYIMNSPNFGESTREFVDDVYRQLERKPRGRL